MFADDSPPVLLRKPPVLVSVSYWNVTRVVESARSNRSVVLFAVVRDLGTNVCLSDGEEMSA
jgi:hypothetical protein